MGAVKHDLSGPLTQTAAGLGLFVSLTAASSAPIKFETIVVQGATAPETGGDTFACFGATTLQNGSVAFEASVWSGGLNFASGVWPNASGTLPLLGLTASRAQVAQLVDFDGADAAVICRCRTATTNARSRWRQVT